MQDRNPHGYIHCSENRDGITDRDFIVCCRDCLTAVDVIDFLYDLSHHDLFESALSLGLQVSQSEFDGHRDVKFWIELYQTEYTFCAFQTVPAVSSDE